MITLKQETADLIKAEMESIPEKYQKPFNSMHEGLGILREEYVELENEIFFGEKKSKHFIEERDNLFNPKDGSVKPDIKKLTLQHHKQKVRQEAIQVAAMACRIIQELT